METAESARPLSIPVVLCGVDSNGNQHRQSVRAHDLTSQSARLDGIASTFAPGTKVDLQFGDTRATATLVWVVFSGSTGRCQAGVRLLDPKGCPWKCLLAEPPNVLRIPERRKSSRYSVNVQIQLRNAAHGVSMHTTTTDIGITGCYVDTLFPLKVGTQLDIVLWLGPDQLNAKATVRASYPGVGMGMEFEELSWAEMTQLYEFINSVLQSTP